MTGLYLAVPSVPLPDAVPGKYKAEYLTRAEPNNDPFLTHDTEAYFMSELIDICASGFMFEKELHTG